MSAGLLCCQINKHDCVAESTNIIVSKIKYVHCRCTRETPQPFWLSKSWRANCITRWVLSYYTKHEYGKGQQGPPYNMMMFQASRPYFHQFSNGDDVSVGLDFANMGEAQAFAKEVSVNLLGLGKVMFGPFWPFSVQSFSICSFRWTQHEIFFWRFCR